MVRQPTASNRPCSPHSTTSATIRAGEGCTDTDDNASIFPHPLPLPNYSSPPNPCDGPLTIHDIQGPFAESPFVTATLTVTGIVTARAPNGFFIQLPDAETDADPNTSEGIFVFTDSAPFAAAEVGNRVA